MMTNLQKEIQQVFKKFPEYWEGETLLKNKAIEDIREYEPNLLAALLENETIKETYSVEINGNYIFKNEEFISMLRYKNYLENSYTKYSNQIGLTSDDKYLNYSSDVVLDFPHKDGVLEGGMTQEDSAKQEIFYHNVLAKEEIDLLLRPKVLTNSIKYGYDNSTSTSKITNDDNLVIKGNNFIALASLLDRYKGQIQCIYIDPPYNPRSDANTFAYNNRFNQSTWLTFMKNRLELAKELLSDDGVIFIDIDHNELFYLGVLADEIFGYQNRIGNLAIVHNLKGRYNGFFSIAHENKLVYAKNSNNAEIKEMLDDTSHKYPQKDKISRYKIVNLQRTGNGSLRKDRPNLFYPIYYSPKTNVVSTTKFDDSIKILPIDDNGIERRWRWGKDKLEKDWETETVVRKQKDRYKIYTKIREKGDRPKTLWSKPEYSGTTGTNRLKQLIGENEFTYPKSVQLVIDSLSIATDEDSIVLDFFGGSGTTGEAVMKLNEIDNGNRKFILVEQMDYINTVLTPRLKSIIKNEQNNQSFIYTELYELNQVYINEIQDAINQEDIEKLLEKLQESDFLNLKVDLNKVFNENDEFFDLKLSEQKAILIQVLDNNQLYLSYSEIDDDQYAIDKETKAFNASFYDEEE